VIWFTLRGFHTDKTQKELGLELGIPSFKLSTRTTQLVMASLPPSGPNHCWLSPAPWHISRGEGGKRSHHPGNAGAHGEVRGRGGNRLGTAPFWPTFLTLSHGNGSEKRHFKTELK